MAHLYKRGSKYWISYYLNGRLVQKSLKTKNERVALSKKRRLEYELSIGDLHLASKLPLPVILELLCKHLQNIRTYKSYKNDISRLRTFFGPICEQLKPYVCGIKREASSKRSHVDKYKNAHVKAELLEDVTTETINRFLADRIEYDNWKPKTANLMRQILHKLFAYAIKHHGFRSRDRRYPNPASAAEKFREAASQIKFLTIKQIGNQLKSLEKHPTIHVMLATYIYAGLRREEALCLTHEDANLIERLIRVQAKI